MRRLFNRLLVPCLSTTFLVITPPTSFAQEQSLAAQLDRFESLIKAGKAPAILSDLELITKKHPRSARAWALLSKAYLDSDQVTTKSMVPAANAIRTSLELDPNLATSYRALAELQARQGNFAAALQTCEKGLACHPPDPFIYRTRALIYSETKKDKEAVAAYEKFVALKPTQLNRSETLDIGAMCYQRAGMVDKALAIYDGLYKKTRDPSWFSKRAECLAAHGRAKEAIAGYSDLIAHFPDDEVALFEKGKLEARLGMNKEALADFTAAIKAGASPSMFAERAKIYDKMGNAALAEQDREKAKEDTVHW